MASQHPASVSYVMLQEQVINGLCDLMDFSLSHDLAKLHDQSAEQLYWWEPLMVSLHLAKF